MNNRIVLARRPYGQVTLDCFRLVTVPVPAVQPGQVLLRTLYLSLDPYMRGRMNDSKSYAEPVAIGEVMCGATVCRVEESRSPGFQAGDVVLANTGWQDYAAAATPELVKLNPSDAPVSWVLGILGMPGLTAYLALLDIGEPKSGETVVVASATGAVGAAVGQIAKLKGCRVVGIAGGREKCDYAVSELGFDACLDHHQDELAVRLAAACPAGIDVYFENVGGPILMAVLPLLNLRSRIPVCGMIAWYNLTELPPGPDFTPVLMRTILRRRVKIQGFIIYDHGHRHAEFQGNMVRWLKDGKIKYREDLIEGLELAPQGLIGLLGGNNFGKLVVRVSR
jgi:NADPH-dependent curcumin reductase CurA